MKHTITLRIAAPVVGLAGALFAWQAWSSSAAAWQRGDMIAESRALTARGSSVGEVVVNDRVTIRIRHAAGGYSPPERADRVASRLNELRREARLRADDVRVGNVNGQAAVMAGNELIITADAAHARANATTPERLAAQWRNNLAAALGGDRVAVANKDTRQVAADVAVHEETRTKLVPILSVGSGARIGVAQVAGPVSRIDDVKVVAEIATDYKDAARIRILVPISTENVIQNIQRVPQVSVTGHAGLRL